MVRETGKDTSRWKISRHEGMIALSSGYEEAEHESKWGLLVTLALPMAVVSGYLLVLAAMLSVLEPQGVGWTMATLGIGSGVGTVVLVLLKRGAERETISVLGGEDDSSG